MFFSRLLCPGVLLALGTVLAPADVTSGGHKQRYALPPHGELELTLRQAWKSQSKPSPRNLPPTIEISPSADQEFVILITSLPVQGTIIDRADLKGSLERLAQAAVAQSVEKRAVMVPLKGPQTDGCYFSVTDSAPAPGEYKYMSQGLANVGELLLQFTILSNDPTQKVRDAGLEMLRGAAHLKTAAAAELEVPIPGRGWKLRLLNPALGVLQQHNEPDRFVCRAESAEGFHLSLFVEKPDGPGNQHADVFNHYWPQAKQNPLIQQDSVKISHEQKFVKVEYVTAGMPNVNYYFAFKGRWVDLHISKLPFAKKDEALFVAFGGQLAYAE